MKKNIIKSVIAAVFVVGTVVSFNMDAKANMEYNSGVKCYCYDVTGQCAANGSGASCAPDGKSKCWKYDGNCVKIEQ